jgi:hypothetical protein
VDAKVERPWSDPRRDLDVQVLGNQRLMIGVIARRSDVVEVFEAL